MRCANSSTILPSRIDEYEALLTKNPLFLERTKGIGVITAEECVALGDHRPDPARCRYGL